LHAATPTHTTPLSLHDALPIFWINHVLGWCLRDLRQWDEAARFFTTAVTLRKDNPIAWTNLGAVLQEKGATDEAVAAFREALRLDRKSTRLNSSHRTISYAVFC